MWFFELAKVFGKTCSDRSYVGLLGFCDCENVEIVARGELLRIASRLLCVANSKFWIGVYGS